ncbi:leader peptidase (prepilin peptidase) / N-methyltransferase [Gracilibacillus orientalis]|uniref:Leader peptidase (Prepilin peptidase) / N-methyltransferase n=1 Tax=Gracilibacillus orientalis TaxID=334253 RepID=A0A1I4MRP2_9BACI|nr:A24 family peptidase [Gracilibacillus orientalis]SFM05705.1 leader peptidase (prepilin peptidase) / N-methyltransferase [Gracilibacillus orientalis]
MDILYSGLFFVLGLVLGSFYNVVGLRIPQRTFLSSSRSACPTCNHTLKWYELIPVLSFLIQKGKCRYCQQSISYLYPTVELITGIGFQLSYLYLGISLDLWITFSLISLFSILLVTDLRFMIIPNKILLFFLPIFILLRVFHPLEPWWSSITGSVAGYGIIALIIIVSRGGMGAGDMKLLGLLGVLLGFSYILLAFFIAILIGLLSSGLVLIKRGFKAKQEVPFGPTIVLGAIIALLFGDEIINAYTNLMILK